MRNELLAKMPPMLSGAALRDMLAVLPEYDPDIQSAPASQRLIALEDLYRLYIPSEMSAEIYTKLYLATLRSLRKKNTITAVKQYNQNHRAIIQQPSVGIMGGSDSFTVIGPSGIGKSSAISRSIALVSDNKIIELRSPYSKVIPCLVVQTPYDSSVKGLLLEILRKIDERIDTEYYKHALKIRSTTDILIGAVSNACINHVGLLVCDEIQHVVNSKHGKALVGMLTQLINNSGVSVCMVGTPESSRFFEQAFQLARRSLGLQYGAMSYGESFYLFCQTLFGYQYTQETAELSDAIAEWLYSHSGGNVSVVVSLYHDTQELAIMSGRESVDIHALDEAYEKRLSFLHGFLENKARPQSHTGRVKSSIQLPELADVEVEMSVSDMVAMSKAQQMDIVNLLTEYITVEAI
jgi:hypothetical protein